MNNQQHHEIMLFNAALEMPSGEREEYLDQICRGDIELYHRVQELLRVHGQAAGFMEGAAEGAPLSFHTASLKHLTPHVGTVPEPFAVGEKVAGYRILDKIGEGDPDEAALIEE